MNKHKKELANLKKRSFEIIQMSKKKKRQSEENLKKLWDIIKRINLCFIRILGGGGERTKGRKLIS